MSASLACYLHKTPSNQVRCIIPIADHNVYRPQGLCVDHLLHFGVGSHHSVVDIRMVPHQNLGIPSRSDEDRIDAASYRRHEDLAHLQANQKGKCQHDRSVGATGVVCWFGEFQVQVCKEGTKVTDECRAHGKDWADQAIVHKSVNAPVFHHFPGVFSGGDVGLSIKGYVRESVAIKEPTRYVSDVLEEQLLSIKLTVRPIPRDQ